MQKNFTLSVLNIIQPFFLNATALSLTLAGMSMKLALRLTTLVLHYGLRVVTAILDILDGKAKGIKVTIETNK